MRETERKGERRGKGGRGGEGRGEERRRGGHVRKKKGEEKERGSRESRERMGGEGKRVPRRGKKGGRREIGERISPIAPLTNSKNFSGMHEDAVFIGFHSLPAQPQDSAVHHPLPIRFSASPFGCSLAKHSQYFFLVSTSSNLI